MTDADLGAALPLPVPSAEMQDRLARRRSASAQSLAAPGPTRAEIERVLLLGARCSRTLRKAAASCAQSVGSRL